MHFKRLVIQGFKTFANRTVFEFRPGVTAIVGSNGTGKSNVSDAVRWVLGEQSMATLRCKRTEELLFSGGTRRAPAGLAEVSLTIDNSKRLLPLAFDEVTFTRRATRAGDNEYFINRARVRLRDVLEATEPLGNSYTIINQGLVDTALTLKPEERRRLFEDAAEIGGFEARKAEAERRLRDTDANMQRAADLLGELEPRLRALKRQATQARQHRELSEELRNLLLTHYARLVRAACRALLAAKGAEQASAAALEGARAAHEAAAVALRELRAALRELRERLGGLHQQSGALHQQAETAQRELAVGAERLAALGRQADELQRAIDEASLREGEARRDHEATHVALDAAEADAAARREALREHETVGSQREQARRALDRDLAQAQDAALKAATATAEQQARAEQHQHQRQRLEREQQGQHVAVATAEAQHERLCAEQAAAQAALDAALAERADAQRMDEVAHAALDALRHERAASDEALAAARRVLADVEARHESLDRLARSYAGTFAGVKAAMQWAERANRVGFALVSSIVRTPPQLETAIEVALGSRLQNVVAERWQDAEDAIAELKRSGAGRATFLPLDSLRPAADNPALASRQSSVLGIAAELVEYDEHYRVVVWHLLGRTLVVEDLATAHAELRRIGGGWGIVTLGGEQVSGGGAITGGAQTRESGALRRERELRELPRQVEAARSSVAAAETQRRALGERVAAAERAARDAEALRQDRVRTTDARRAVVEAAERGRSHAEQDLTWQRGRSAAFQRDLVALCEQARALADGRTRADEVAQVAQAQLAAARARQELAAANDGAAQAALNEARAAFATAEAQLGAGRTLAAGQQQALERLARQRGESFERLTQLAHERAALEVRRATGEGHHAELVAQSDVLRQQIIPAEAALADYEQRQAALEAEEARGTSALLEHEASHGRAVLEAQRARDRLDTTRDRAAADGIALPDDTDAPDADDSAAAGDDLQSTIHNLQSKIERLGSVNPLALEEYEETAERHAFLSGQITDIRQAQESLRSLIGELDAAVHERFAATFAAVASEFEQSFTRLFGGGTAQLQLVGAESGTNGAEPAELDSNGTQPNGRRAGVEIMARPPGKRMQNLSLLSGGERTLTAAALLFAILKINPSPFCIMDEVDAALDESNVGRFREALLDLSHQTQFILITHNRGTIEAADTLYGISMGDDGGSKALSLKLAELVKDEG